MMNAIITRDGYLEVRMNGNGRVMRVEFTGSPQEAIDEANAYLDLKERHRATVGFPAPRMSRVARIVIAGGMIVEVEPDIVISQEEIDRQTLASLKDKAIEAELQELINNSSKQESIDYLNEKSRQNL